MGFGRGKVGSVVLARSKGQQVARAYNDAPKNPRSEGQMMQRSIFASAVKFFSQGRQAFYQFAYENKSAKQSDYNAFVSANAKRGMHVSKAAFDESTYPVLAPWMMSKGSLPELDLVYDNEGNKYKLNLPGLSAGANWGAVSQLLKDMYGLNGGDIVTIVTINAQGSNADNTPAVEPEKRGQIKWDIKQALLDVGSESAVADIFGTGAVAIEGGITFMGVASADTACGACVTISRMTDAGLKVNDSYIVMNGVAATIYENCKAQDYIDEVLASWKASGKAILEGGMLPVASETSIDKSVFFLTKTDFNDASDISFVLYNADNEMLLEDVEALTVNGVRMVKNQRYQLSDISGYFSYIIREDSIIMSHYDDASTSQSTKVTANLRITEVSTTSGILHFDPNVKANIKYVRGASNSIDVINFIERSVVGDKVKAATPAGGDAFIAVEGEYTAQLIMQNLTAVPAASRIETGVSRGVFYIDVYGNFSSGQNVEIFANGVKLFSYDIA